MLQSFFYKNRFTITILWIFYQPLQMPITKPWIKEIFNLQSSMHGIRSMLWKPQVIISTQFEHAFKRERPDVETQVNNECLPALLLTSWRIRGLRVTMPDPLGRKSLNDRHRHVHRMNISTVSYSVWKHQLFARLWINAMPATLMQENENTRNTIKCTADTQ